MKATMGVCTEHLALDPSFTVFSCASAFDFLVIPYACLVAVE